MYADLFHKQYDFELEQRNTIASSTNIPLVTITAVASATCVILLDFQYSQKIKCYFFVFFVCVDILFFLKATFLIFRSFWNYT